MKLTNIAQFNNLKDYVSYKLEQFKNKDKNAYKYLIHLVNL